MEDDSIVRIHVRGSKGSLYRSGYLTPYFAETVAGDLRRGRPEPVEAVLHGDSTTIAVLRRELATIDRSGIRIVYRQIPKRDDDAAAGREVLTDAAYGSRGPGDPPRRASRARPRASRRERAPRAAEGEAHRAVPRTSRPVR